MSGLTIGEVARRAGVRTSTLRYYEGAGLLRPAERVNGRRRYDESVFGRLAAVRLARDAGFTIGEIRTLFGSVEEGAHVPEAWRAMAGRKLAEVDALIERAMGMRRILQEGIDCGCVSFEECGRLYEAKLAAG